MRTERGMSLIELMVAVVIGLIGCVVIFQVYSVAEAQKRSVSSGSDMDVAGRLALMTLERDLNLAGYGYGMAAAENASPGGPMLGCAVTAYDNQRTVTDFTYPFVPVMIQQGAGGAPDSITILKGSSDLLSIGKVVDDGNADKVRTKFGVGRAGIRKGDVVVVAFRSPTLQECGMFEITDDADADGMSVRHEPLTEYETALGVKKSTRYNKIGGLTFQLGTREGKLYNLGPSPARSVWSILPPKTTSTAAQGAKLVVTNDLAWTDVNGDGQNDLLEAADLVVNLQAEYGIDVNNDGIVDTGEWFEVPPTDAATFSPPLEWSRVLAIRFAILTRAQQFEKEPLYEMDGSSPPKPLPPRWFRGQFVMTNVDGTVDDNPSGAEIFNNWRHYRYKVFEAVVPMRNTLIGKAPL